MNIIFMGTPDFASPTLSAILSTGHKVSAVVTQPDKPSGRGRILTMPPVKVLAEANKIPVFQPDKIKNAEFVQLLKEFSPDVIVVVAYGKILPKEILNLPTSGCINVHASLLPKLRGAGPIQWSLINGETKTGITIMKMDEGMDTGEIIMQEELEILEDDDTTLLSNALSVIGATLLVNVLNKLEKDGKIDSQKQDNSQATYAPMLKKGDGKINWMEHVDKIYNLIRGVTPNPGAYTTLDSQAIKILKASPYDYAIPPITDKQIKERSEIPRYPGEILSVIKGKGIVVRTGSGGLLIETIQPSSKPAMTGESFINGRFARIGSKFQ